MGRGLYKLNARGVATTDQRGRYADGGGLYLQVDGRGTRQWTFRFQIDGRCRATIKVRHVVNQGETAPGWTAEGRA